MRSPAPKQAESEFDELLGQLTDELAMTPASNSAVNLVPDLEPPKVHVAATGRMAAEAAAAAGVLQPVAPSKPDTTMVKIVGIIAASLTVVSVVALVVFGTSKSSEEPVAVVDEAAIAQSERDEAAEAAQRKAEREAHAQAIEAERAANQAEFARIEAKRLSAQLAASTDVGPKKPKPRKPKPKPEVGGDFDEL